MPKVITICCHGTDNGSRSSPNRGKIAKGEKEGAYGGGENHVTERVYQNIQDPVRALRLEGVGSEEFVQGVGKNIDYGIMGGATAGVLAGVGLEENVAEAVRWSREQLGDQGELRVNLLGFSRGAVTCFKIANQLEREMPQRTRVRIFAIDPVPGNTIARNDHCYENIKLLPNVSHCKVIYAEDERRDNFQPVLVHQARSTTKFGYAPKNWRDQMVYLMDTMPGNHGGIVDIKGGGTDGTRIESVAPLLVESQALEFLRDGDVAFSDNVPPRSMVTDLNRYGRLMMALKTKDQWMGTHNYGFGDNATPQEGFGANLLGGLSGADREMLQKRPGKVKESWLYKFTPDVKTGSKQRTFNKMSMNGKFQAHLKTKRRFFCNVDHMKLFEHVGYGALRDVLRRLEMGCRTDLEGKKAYETKRIAHVFAGATGNKEAAEHLQTYLGQA